jgi:hypothetical protein
MEILVYIILGTIFGVSVGNTNIRNKIGQELKQIMTQERSERVVKDCPIKKPVYKATYKKPEEPDIPKFSKGGCNKCGGNVEPIDKMPGYFFCTACNSITSKKKTEAK